MDCFYAAIEVRDQPHLEGKAVAVGGSSTGRGVLTTCNYEARRFGCRSAMPTFQALQRCPHLIVLPVRFDVYRDESRRIRKIFQSFTALVEPLSLDEAYLDVSHLRSGGWAIAREIREQIHELTGLTASAGIAPNKLIAKIASDWRKPNGQFEVRLDEVAAFMKSLSVRKLWGVGGKTAERLASVGIETCEDLQGLTMTELHRLLGRFGGELFHQSRGLDERPVRADRERKSLSNERTFSEDLTSGEACLEKLEELFVELSEDYQAKHADRRIKSQFVKLKFSDFQQTTVERQCECLDLDQLQSLLADGWKRGDGRKVRLLGAGVRFVSETETGLSVGQLDLFGLDEQA